MCMYLNQEYKMVMTPSQQWLPSTFDTMFYVGCVHSQPHYLMYAGACSGGVCNDGSQPPDDQQPSPKAWAAQGRERWSGTGWCHRCHPGQLKLTAAHRESRRGESLYLTDQQQTGMFESFRQPASPPRFVFLGIVLSLSLQQSVWVYIC